MASQNHYNRHAVLAIAANRGFAAAMVLFYIPCPSLDVARDIVDTMLSEGLIACGNILAPMESRYVWEGKVACETEVPVLLKTSENARARVVERIAEIHPYDVPAILCWDVRTNPEFGDWVRSQT